MSDPSQFLDYLRFDLGLDGIAEGVSGTGPTCRIDFTPAATQEQIDLANAARGTFDWSAGAEAGRTNLAQRARAKAMLDDKTEAAEKLLRAVALVTMDEINTLRSQHGLAARTAAQLKAAIRAKLDRGAAD